MKRIVILALILAGLYGVLYLKNQNEPKINQVFFPDLKEQLVDVNQITIKNGQQTFNVNQINNNWVVESLSNYPAAIPVVRQVLLSMSQLKPVDKMTTLEKNYGALGLTNETATQVSIKDMSILLGKIDADRQYVRLPSDQQVWTAQPALPDLSQPIKWVSTEIINVRDDGVKSVKFIKNGKEQLHAFRASKEEGFKFKNLKNAKLDNSKTTAVLGGIFQHLHFQDVKPANTITAKPEMIVQVDTFDDILLELILYKQDNKTWGILSADHYGQSQQNATFATLVNTRSQWAYALAPNRIQNMQQKDFLQK